MLQGKNLASDDPRQRSPRGREEEDVDADKGNARLLRSDVVHDDGSGRVLARRQGPQHGDEELRRSHSDGAPEQEGSTTEFVDGVQAGECRENVDHRGDNLDNEGVFQSGVLEVLSSWGSSLVNHVVQ